MEWGWSDEFPDIRRRLPRRRDAELAASRVAQPVGELALRGGGLRRMRRADGGPDALSRPRQREWRRGRRGRGPRLDAARRQGGTAGDLRGPGTGPVRLRD